jgi:hypothetical protein
MLCHVRSISLLTLLFLSLNISAQAKSHLNSLPANTRADLQLLKNIVDSPQLLSPKYLECYLGPKALTMTAPFSQSLRSPAPVMKTFWLDRGENYPRYTLEQIWPASNKFLAEFSFVLSRPEDLLLTDVSKTLDEAPTKVIDANGRPAFAYACKDPTMKVLAYQDSHIVNLTKIAVQYSGPILLPPTTEQMNQAIEHRHEAALVHARSGHHDKAVSLLHSHLQSNPNDAEAHLQLADSYKASSCVNEAIGEYKAALANCGNNKELHDRCIEGLPIQFT